MPEHNHITRGDVVGCPSCDVREGRGAGLIEVDWVEPGTPDLSAFPEVQHRIESSVFVCPGDETARCHQYPGCEHDEWPCGCEYTAHAECWIKPWIDGSCLADSHDEDADDLGYLLLDADFPDGDVETQWHGDYVLWNYVLPDPRLASGSSVQEPERMRGAS